ncbi:MAG: AmmeMemoRadiSam system protein B [Ardenticatenaceae bacterium]|nr:AmmeMemoRadiSam system protein B [Ardenticatenaceae bacterium]
MWYLRDPLRLTEQQLVMPQVLAQILPLLDGTRDEAAIHQEFCRQLGEWIDVAIVQNTLARLDEACLLENERAQQAMAGQLAAFRGQPHRQPALANLSYPGDPAALRALFRQYAAGSRPGTTPPWTGRAIVSPHIDYQRGGPVYARVWQQAAEAVAEAELVVIFGTDHNGANNLITLTRQAYATPFGVLPAVPALVDRLAEAYGPEKAFAAELNHRDEHSIELSAVWLHYTFEQAGREACPMLPVLCGSFYRFVANGDHPAGDEALSAFIHTLQQETAGKKVLAVASVDFAHVGPNFGDDFPMDQARRAWLTTGDKSLIAAVNQGDHARFYQEIAAIQDRNRICGFSSIYTMLRYLQAPGREPLRGLEVAYDHCPADAEDTSLVSIAGLLLA